MGTRLLKRKRDDMVNALDDKSSMQYLSIIQIKIYTRKGYKYSTSMQCPPNSSYKLPFFTCPSYIYAYYTHTADGSSQNHLCNSR